MTCGRGNGKISATAAASQILNWISKGHAEIDVGATTLLRLILRLSPALGERIMIGRLSESCDHPSKRMAAAFYRVVFCLAFTTRTETLRHLDIVLTLHPGWRDPYDAR